MKSEKKKPVPHNLEDDPVFGKKKKKCGIYREKRTLVRRKEKVTMVSGNKIMVDFYFLL